MGAWDFLRRWLSRWDECAGRGLCAKAGHLSALRRPPLRSGAGPDKCGAFAVHFETATDQKILRRRRPVPTLAAASRGGAESCAQGRAKCVQACTFVGREPPVRSNIRRRVVWNCRSGRCGHTKVRRVTPRPFVAARCTIPRGLLSSRFLNSAARSQAPAAGRRSMLSDSQITSSTPLVRYVIHEDTVR